MSHRHLSALIIYLLTRPSALPPPAYPTSYGFDPLRLAPRQHARPLHFLVASPSVKARNNTPAPSGKLGRSGRFQCHPKSNRRKLVRTVLRTSASDASTPFTFFGGGGNGSAASGCHQSSWLGTKTASAWLLAPWHLGTAERRYYMKRQGSDAPRQADGTFLLLVTRREALQE
ncbi:hypothetical protein FA95DRAFT_823603 [Auriscalpium vulgare]|uniref:Uncharacterized protein n=1 Tax=Auriscalpium vulgare TaxID=40419 RepID=A0ACB8R9W0_9AGAM|nr:hypothetical protein FA95DRAFT_823603 [Auriscalpium vulgare]